MNPNTVEQTWTAALSLLKDEVNPHTYQTWLEPLRFLGTQEDTFSFEVPNRFYRERLEQNYAPLIRRALCRAGGRESLRPTFVVSSEPARHSPPDPTTPLGVEAPGNTPGQAPLGPAAGLSPRYTFDSFVVGNGNQFAHAAASAVASSPGTKYNPLFIYGGVGLGKTHLLVAVGNALAARGSGLRVRYRTSEQFTNELINAIRFEKTEAFRQRYRATCDVLLLDDIQFLAGKERTQEEFFHTFNTLYQNNRQIVLTSDQLPHEIGDLDERLRSRFQCGLASDIQPPDVETRIAILRKKAELESVSLPDEVAQFLARRIRSNVRLLEGALIRLAAQASLSGREITLDLTEEVFGRLLPEPSQITVDLIQKRVATFFHLPIADLKSSSRKRQIALPRQVAMYLCRKLTRASFPEIGQAFGGKDHTTVMHGAQKIQRLLPQDHSLRHTISAIEQSLET